MAANLSSSPIEFSSSLPEVPDVLSTSEVLSSPLMLPKAMASNQNVQSTPITLPSTPEVQSNVNPARNPHEDAWEDAAQSYAEDVDEGDWVVPEGMEEDWNIPESLDAAEERKRREGQLAMREKISAAFPHSQYVGLNTFAADMESAARLAEIIGNLDKTYPGYRIFAEYPTLAEKIAGDLAKLPPGYPWRQTPGTKNFSGLYAIAELAIGAKMSEQEVVETEIDPATRISRCPVERAQFVQRLVDRCEHIMQNEPHRRLQMQQQLYPNLTDEVESTETECFGPVSLSVFLHILWEDLKVKGGYSLIIFRFDSDIKRFTMSQDQTSHGDGRHVLGLRSNTLHWEPAVQDLHVDDVSAFCYELDYPDSQTRRYDPRLNGGHVLPHGDCRTAVLDSIRSLTPSFLQEASYSTGIVTNLEGLSVTPSPEKLISDLSLGPKTRKRSASSPLASERKRGSVAKTGSATGSPSAAGITFVRGKMLLDKARGWNKFAHPEADAKDMAFISNVDAFHGGVQLPIEDLPVACEIDCLDYRKEAAEHRERACETFLAGNVFLAKDPRQFKDLCLMLSKYSRTWHDTRAWAKLIEDAHLDPHRKKVQPLVYYKAQIKAVRALLKNAKIGIWIPTGTVSLVGSGRLMVAFQKSPVRVLSFDPKATFDKYNMPYAFLPENEHD